MEDDDYKRPGWISVLDAVARLQQHGNAVASADEFLAVANRLGILRQRSVTPYFAASSPEAARTAVVEVDEFLYEPLPKPELDPKLALYLAATRQAITPFQLPVTRISAPLDEFADYPTTSPPSRQYMSAETLAYMAARAGWKLPAELAPASEPAPELADELAAPPREGKPLSLSRERTLLRIIGALVVAVADKEPKVRGQRPGADAAVGRLAVDLERHAKNYRQLKGQQAELPNRFGLSDDSSRTAMNQGLAALVDDYWSSDPT